MIFKMQRIKGIKNGTHNLTRAIIATGFAVEEPSEMVYLLYQTYGSSFQHKRGPVNAIIEINLYEGINFSRQPRPVIIIIFQ